MKSRAVALIVERDGSIAVITALLLPVIVGFFALALEPAFWMQVQRNAQNAADSAVLAAATNGSAAYADEASAVAARYGLVNGQNNVSIQVAENVSCPAAAGGGATCYSVTITRSVPLLLTSMVGYRGDATVDGSPAKSIVATAVSIRGTIDRPYCVLALAGSGAQGIRTNGAPKANLSGCNIMSNTTADCNGHNLSADVGDAHGTNSGCGVQANSNQPAVTDPYSGLAGNIPSNPCSSYPQEPGKKGTALPSTNTFSGTLSWSGSKVVCGDMQLTGDLTLSTGGTGGVLVIENGQLDTNGHTIRTASGSAVTVVFSGDNGSYTHAPTGGGSLDIAAPTSGAWSGVAIYQDPGLTTGVDISAAGNSPTWAITGLVYLPHASVTFSGAVNKSSNGASCFDLVVDNLLINGTGSILAHGQCDKAGLSMPAGKVPGRGKLVT